MSRGRCFGLRSDQPLGDRISLLTHSRLQLAVYSHQLIFSLVSEMDIDHETQKRCKKHHTEVNVLTKNQSATASDASRMIPKILMTRLLETMQLPQVAMT